MPASLTAAQRRCPHARVRPTLDARYEQCAACGYIRVAPITAPWMLEYDASAEPAPAPELWPDRDAQTYIEESNAATRSRRSKSQSKTQRSATTPS